MNRRFFTLSKQAYFYDDYDKINSALVYRRSHLLFSKSPILRVQNGHHRNGVQNHDTSWRAAGRCHGYCDGCSAAAEAIEGSNKSPRSPLSIRSMRLVSGRHQGLSFGHFVSHYSNSSNLGTGRQSGCKANLLGLFQYSPP